MGTHKDSGFLTLLLQDEHAGLEAKANDPEVQTNYEEIPKITAALEAAQAETEKLYERWEELSALKTD